MKKPGKIIPLVSYRVVMGKYSQGCGTDWNWIIKDNKITVPLALNGKGLEVGWQSLVFTTE